MLGGTGRNGNSLVSSPLGEVNMIKNLERRIGAMEGETEPESKFSISEAMFAESMSKIAATIPPDLEGEPSPEVAEAMKMLKGV